ncbi:MAG: hypothetical protein E6J66_03715 [Deltaproteobacteria bacterium]|nr:MAG: hypothetical protein E6J66_03715 [Deltaproteobacteria bacterium]
MSLVLAILLAAADPAAAYKDLNRANLGPTEARTRVAGMVQALNDLAMPRTATVLLASLASDPEQSEAVRAAARAELAARAAADPALAQLLLTEQAEHGKLPSAVAVAIARDHLERALQIAPPDEDAAFETERGAPALEHASSPAHPLDKELAAEMGLSAPEPVVTPAREPQRSLPAQAQRELDLARALAASVPPGDAAEGEAREVAALAALAAGDPAQATKEFLAVAALALPRGDAAAAERREKAYLQLARLAYQRSDDALATTLYDRVGRGAPQWLDALFEASWAHFRRGEDERALGNLLTLHAPFFQERFFPESFILKALVLYENCRYADARAALADFQRRYQPLHDGLAQALSQIPTPQAAAELLARGPVGVQQAVPAAAREEVARLEQGSDLRGALAAAVQLAQEIDSIDRRPDPFRASPLVARVAPLARQARARLLETAGRRLIARLDHERATLRELLGQSLRLSYEIAGREKELATSGPDAALSAQPHRDPPQVGDDEELWPFQGEYWRDELGSYRYQLGRRCKRPRTPAPTASQPAASPPAAVAGTPAD